MEVNVKVIAKRCRLCTADTENTSFDIFSTCGLQLKIRKYLQITIKTEDYLPKIVCTSCYHILQGFDRLCNIASTAQKELLQMLNEAKVTAKEVKSVNKRKIKKDKSIWKTETPKTKRKRRKNRSEGEAKNSAIENPATPELILGLPSPDFWANFQLGQIIRDTELIKLILKALKWTDNEENMERLRSTDLGVVLGNSDLLHDDDLIKLIKSYMVHDGNNNSTCDMSWTMDHDPNSVTEMEVKVDPSLFLPEDTEDMETDDSRTVSVDLNELIGAGEIAKEYVKEPEALPPPFECTSCPDRFVSHVQLQDHVLTHLIKRSQDAEAAADAAKKTKKRSRKKKPVDSTKLSTKEKENDPTKVCSYCQKQFKRRQDLKFHINQHTGERPFKCVSCPKAFASSGNCLTHRKRMHPELFKKKEN